MRRIKALLMAAGVVLTLAASGCVRAEFALLPDETLPPEATPTAEPTPSPTPEPSPTAAPMLYDALGGFITGPGYFERYIEFTDIQVYEQCEDTFMDAVAVNSYTEPIVCALDICFYKDGEQIAIGKLQTRDGSYVLTLQPGENTVFARIDTDMTLTGEEFRLVYDDSLGIMPDVTGSD